MKATRKNLSISIDYGANADAIKCLQKLIHLMRQGQTRYERETINGAILEFSIKHSEPPVYREETINGQFCHVVESKLNKQLRIEQLKHRKK